MATCHPLRVPVCFDRLSSSSNASPSWHSSNNLPLGVHHNNHNVGQTGPSDPNHLWGVVSHPHSSDHSAEAPCSSSHLALDHGFQPSSLLAINLPLFNPADHQAIPTLEPLGPETDGRICLGLRNGRVRIYSEAALLATSASQFSASPGIPIDRKHSSSSVSLATAASSSRQSAATSSETPKAPPPFAGFGANQGSNRIRSASSSSLGFGNPSLTGPSTSAENAVSADGQAVQPSPKEAEAELELQWHASERSELSSHSHGVVGVVGGVFAKWSAGKEGEHPHEHVVKKQRRASKAQAEQAQGQTSDDGTRRSGVIPSSAGERDPFQQTTFPDITKRLPLKEEDSGDQLYRPLAEFLTPDSSPVIGLHVYRRPTLSGTRSLCLLSVQEEGRISSWSLETGEMVWDLDLALVASDRMTSISDPNKPEVGAPSGGLVRFPSLLALRSQTGSPSPSAKASFTECTGEDVGDDKFQERIAVRIGASEFLPPLEAGLFPLGSLSLWDMRSERLLLLDPQGGKIILSQLVEKATPSFRPRFIVESGSLKAEWIEEGSPLKMVKRTISVTSSIPTSPERETLRGSESSPDLTTSRIPLPTLDSFSPDRIWKVDNFVFTTSPSRFHILEAGEDKFTLMHQFDLDGVRNLLLSPSDETSVILMRSDGYACINLDSMNIIQSSLTGIAMLSQYASSAVFASSPWTRPTRPIFGAGYDETKGTFVFQAIDPSTGSLQNQFEEKFRRQIGDDGEQTCSISCLLPLSLEKIVVSLSECARDRRQGDQHLPNI
ncbi:hypothetical protein IE53DRAFT_282066 [Violaceomyces palustris]|uniref:Uncharacterized protein n=1 Tax=Violaceomyces palustris TaxID=1673888 RepID=A0ACD0P2U6_9BASI|nr:hypothetical protein IE53DRAFT_282066 [Violaceomyces palustris]